VAGFYLSVRNRIGPKLDVGLIFGSLLKFSVGLKLGWEVFGEFCGLAVREDRVADNTSTLPYYF
jgi:hypothetical protein